jgi:hypothetical protein
VRSCVPGLRQVTVSASSGSTCLRTRPFGHGSLLHVWLFVGAGAVKGALHRSSRGCVKCQTSPRACRLAQLLSREQEREAAYLLALPTLPEWPLPARIQMDNLFSRAAYPAGQVLDLGSQQLVFLLAGSIALRQELFDGGTTSVEQRRQAARLHGMITGHHHPFREPPKHCLKSTTVRGRVLVVRLQSIASTCTVVPALLGLSCSCVCKIAARLQIRVYMAGTYFVTHKAPGSQRDRYVAAAVVEVATCPLERARSGLSRLGLHGDKASLQAFSRTARGLSTWRASAAPL